MQNPQPNATELTSAVWYLRLARTGDTYTASYSADGESWTAFEPLTNAAVGATPKVGLFSLGAARPPSKTVSFDYFRLSTEAVDDDPAGDDGHCGRHGRSRAGTPARSTVTLAATDNEGGSGVARTEYQLDDATTWTAYTEPIAVAGDGTHEVRFGRSTRRATLRRPGRSSVQIDTTAPVTTAEFAPPSDGGWHAGAVPVSLDATDAGSGVGKIEWSLDGGAWTPYTEPVDVTGDGEHELLYRATDEAGNAETLKSAILRIDSTKPTVLVSGLADGQLYGDSQDVRVTFQAVDPTSGIQSLVGTLDGKPYQSGTLQVMYDLTLGLHELVVTATDLAGNETSANVRFFVTTSLRDIQNLLDRFKATSQLSNKAHQKLSKKLESARVAEATGKDERAIKQLRAFIELASDPALVTDADVRGVLVRDAEAMIVRLGGSATAAGTKANGGKSLAGTGRLDGDATRVPAGGKL